MPFWVIHSTADFGVQAPDLIFSSGSTEAWNGCLCRCVPHCPPDVGMVKQGVAGLVACGNPLISAVEQTPVVLGKNTHGNRLNLTALRNFQKRFLPIGNAPTALLALY